MDITTLLGAVAVLAAFNERLLEYTLGRLNNPRINTAMPVVSMALGIVEALAFRMNAVPPEWNAPIIVGQVATGIALGLGSNVVHLLAGRAIKSP